MKVATCATTSQFGADVQPQVTTQVAAVAEMRLLSHCYSLVKPPSPMVTASPSLPMLPQRSGCLRHWPSQFFASLPSSCFSYFRSTVA